VENFEPKIIGFLCNWCSYEGADAAGRARKTYSENLKIIRLPCSGRVDPEFVLNAFKEGADGVLILGCHPGDCHYKEGNYLCLKKYELLKGILAEFGIEEIRFQLHWVSAQEADRFIEIVEKFVQDIKSLGPLKIKIEEAKI